MKAGAVLLQLALGRAAFNATSCCRVLQKCCKMASKYSCSSGHGGLCRGTTQAKASRVEAGCDGQPVCHRAASVQLLSYVFSVCATQTAVIFHVCVCVNGTKTQHPLCSVTDRFTPTAHFCVSFIHLCGG